MDAVAVEAVLEAPGVCADLDRARAVLVEALASSRAPRRSVRGERWTLTVRVSRAPGNTKSAEAAIVDDAGAVVSQRTLSDRGGCATIARGIGAWATLVIDAELDHAHDEPAQPAARQEREPQDPRGALTPAGAQQVGLPRDDADHAPLLAARTGSTEVGGAVYFRGGGTAGGIVGLSPFVVVEVASGWLVRPSLAFGSTKGPNGTNPAHLGARFDFCRRIPGNYIERRGLEADLCAGADGGVIASDTPAGMMSVGPAMALRGDLGVGLMLELRGGLGANLVDAQQVATRSAVTGDAQIGVSGRLP